MKLRHV